LDVSLEAVKGFLSSMVVILVSKIGNNSCFSFQVDDVKTKGKYALQPRADMIKEQIAPLRSWVSELLLFLFWLNNCLLYFPSAHCPSVLFKFALGLSAVDYCGSVTILTYHSMYCNCRLKKCPENGISKAIKKQRRSLSSLESFQELWAPGLPLVDHQ